MRRVDRTVNGKGSGMVRAFAVGMILAAGAAQAAGAQSLTPEQLQAMIDERVNAQNPYRAFLADPDPERSLAAMQIMLESGDPDLVRMALEFGLLSPNPTVRRIAVEAFMASGPVLSLRLDGTEVEDNNYTSFVRGPLAGTLDADGVGFARLDVREISEDGTCYTDDRQRCLFTINSDGVFLSAHLGYNDPRLNARMVVNDAGQLEGFATLYNVADPVPVTIELID
jgi:hypothetical protein